MKKLYQYNNEQLLHLGNISRANALLCLKVKSKLEEILNIDCHKHNLEQYKFLLAVSGGTDSVAMLGIFIALQKKYKLNFQVAHLNHGIRPESEQEKDLVQSICQKFHIDFHYKIENVPEYAKKNNIGLEEAGRLARYQFFEHLREKFHCDYICIAHHNDDLAEDVLMRLLRGTALGSLGGMTEFCSKRKILRPLLELSKAKLKSFITELEFPYAHDLSNEDNEFLRNRVRNKIIPLFLEENPNFNASILHLHQSINIENEHFAEQVQNFLTINCQGHEKEQFIKIPLTSIQKLHKALRLRIYVHIITEKFFSFSSNANLLKLDLALMQNKNNIIIKFTNGLRVKIFENELIFYKK